MPEEPLLPLPAKPALTVLPFVNLDAAPEQDHFSDGLTLDVIAGMVQIPELILVSWVSLGITIGRRCRSTNLAHGSASATYGMEACAAAAIGFACPPDFWRALRVGRYGPNK